MVTGRGARIRLRAGGRGATIALLVAAGSLWSQEAVAQTAVIQGTVTGSDGEPLKDVDVTLQRPDKEVIAREVTGRDGRYRIAGVAAGVRYRLVFGRVGLKDILREDLLVGAGDTLTVVAQLAEEEAVELGAIVVTARRRSPLERRIRAPVTAAEIASRAGLITAQDILRFLRPTAVQSKAFECGNIELKVFIDGKRTDWAMDTLVITQASRQVRENLLNDLPLSLRRMVGKQSNMYAVWLALGKLRVEEIERAEFVNCMDNSVPVAARNAIRIVTKRAAGRKD